MMSGPWSSPGRVWARSMNGPTLTATSWPRPGVQGSRVAQGGEHRAERFDDGLVLGDEGAGGVAAAAEQVTDHRAVSCSGLAVGGWRAS